MAKAFGIVNFAGNHIRVEGMQEYRPVGAFSFLGRYRVIDFPISNMSNSGHRPHSGLYPQKSTVFDCASWNRTPLQYQLKER